MSSLHVVVVSTYPPDRGNLAEYGLHVTQALSRMPGIAKVTVLANIVKDAPKEESPSERLAIRRVWKLDDPSTFLGLAGEASRAGADVVYVNAGIRTWGVSRRASLAGASLPAYLRLKGHRVVTTLHTIGDTVRLDQHGVGPVTRLGMRLASQLYLQSNVVTVTMPSMQRALQQQGARNVVQLSHGTWGARVEHVPQVKEPTILSFGFWGAFKDADLLVEATRQLRERGTPAQLVLGGGAHPYFPEVYQQLKAKHAANPFVRFTGYVPETELSALFSSVSVVVLPYRTNAGASGVLNLCRSYGLPAVVSTEEGLLEQIRFEGGAAMVFDDKASLVGSLERILTTPSLRTEMGERNLEVARRVTIETQAAKLSRLFADVKRSASLEPWLAPPHVQAKPELLAGQPNLVMCPTP